MNFQEKSIEINGKKTFYWEKEGGQKGRAVFLHGFPGSHKGVLEMADTIRDFGIIVPDLPGCGKSEPLAEKHFLKNYSKWLADFLKTIAVGDEVTVIGHSFGARMALAFAEDYPEKVQKLILIAPVVRSDSLVGKIASINYELAELLPPSMQKIWLFNRLTQAIKRKVVNKSPSLKRRRQMMEMEKEEIKNVDTRANREVFEEFSAQKPISSGGQIAGKALIIACGKDKIATLNSVEELYNNRFKGADFKIMKNSGHLVVPESPKAVGNIINKWLSKL